MNCAPVLLIVWRRPNTLRQVIDAIRPISPTRLFVACDGPNPQRSGEAEKVAATRAVIDHDIDWPCHIERLYSDVNQGCRLGVSRAITWFFEQVQEGIILEDDCVPNPCFFFYCTALLERYRHDTRIWSICGSNFQLGNKHGDASYYFSIHGDSWGWASWRRAWQHYPDAEDSWFEFRDSGRLADTFPIASERDYWREILDLLFIEKQPNTWDYQWWLASWMNNGLHAWPNSCLITNLGFDGDGTHTFGQDEFANQALEPLGHLQHAKFVLPCREADGFAFKYRRGGLYRIHKEEYEHEKKTFGVLHPWVLRWRNLKSKGVLSLFASKIRASRHGSA